MFPYGGEISVNLDPADGHMEGWRVKSWVPQVDYLSRMPIAPYSISTGRVDQFNLAQPTALSLC